MAYTYKIGDVEGPWLLDNNFVNTCYDPDPDGAKLYCDRRANHHDDHVAHSKSGVILKRWFNSKITHDVSNIHNGLEESIKAACTTSLTLMGALTHFAIAENTRALREQKTLTTITGMTSLKTEWDAAFKYGFKKIFDYYVDKTGVCFACGST
jgi:hypothetical protein